MLETVQTYAAIIGVAFTAMAIGASWVVTMANPNASFDVLETSPADRQVRELIYRASTPIAGLLLAAAAFGFLATSWAAGACNLLAAFGFFSNRWMLAPKEKTRKGVRTSRKGQRGVSVMMSLMFTFMAVIAVVLGVIGI